MTEKELKQYNMCIAQIQEDNKQQAKIWDEMMNNLKKEKSNDWVKELLEYLEFEEDYFSPSIVNDPKGDKQEIDGNLIKEEWVNQTTNGGYSGDDFGGTIYFKLSENRYLCFHYSM